MIIPVVFVDYELRKDYIVQNFCINKDKPALECDGKCFLAKKLNEAREKEAESAFVSYLLTMESHYLPPVFRLQFIPEIFFEASRQLFAEKSLSLQSICFGFFHPPRV